MLSVYFRYWFVNGSFFWWSLWKTAAAFLEDVIAIKSQIANLTKPLFQDYSREGRFIGLFFRLFRILFGGILYIIISLACAILAIIWLLFPFISIYLFILSLIGNGQ